MQRRTNLQISSTIIILSIITIMVQFTSYYLFEQSYLVWGISCIASVLSCHVLLQQSASYEACYYYSLLTIFNSLSITVLVYLGNVQTFLPYTNLMAGIVVINWLLPLIHCTLRYVIDYGSRVEDFNIFYRNMSIIFIIFYLGILTYALFASAAFEWAHPIKTADYNLLPFEKIASLIEDKLYDKINLDLIISYLLPRILIYMPYGFYIRLVLYSKKRIIRVAVFLLLPLLIELAQYYIIPSRCDIDDILYSLIGSFLGSLFFVLFNWIVRAISGRDFLISNRKRISRGSIHF